MHLPPPGHIDVATISQEESTVISRSVYFLSPYDKSQENGYRNPSRVDSGAVRVSGQCRNIDNRELSIDDLIFQGQ